MKFMKLGSRPDTFYTTEGVRSVSSEISCDLIIEVKGTRYVLHKFPLLSKCLRLQKLGIEIPESSQLQIVQLHDFPGGLEAFELCAKFCYGMTINLSACNIVSTRCAAEYLQMTEDAEKGNLIHKIEVFFNSCILHGWRDLIVTLQSTRAFSLCSEDLELTGRCIEAMASKILYNPLKVNLSQSYTRKRREDLSGHGSHKNRHKALSCKGWWGEDMAELEIDLYWRTMVAIKAGGKVPSNLIGDALKIYASRWLPNVPKYMNTQNHVESGCDLDSDQEKISKHRLLLESIVSLLPADKGAVSCGFLLKLLKATNILKASTSTKMGLAKRAGLQLEEATVNDLLIPSSSSTNDMVYDVDIVMTILEQFMSQTTSPPTSPQGIRKDFEARRSRSAKNIDLEFQESRRSSSASHSSKLKVAKLVDRYLQEIALEKKLPLFKFISIAEVIPEFSRPIHDDLYKAVDFYLKGHPELNKSERKCLCRVLNCKKLSMETCIHAAQNEMLPLRIVVQVLFFEQARAAVAGGQMFKLSNDIKALLSVPNDPPENTVLRSGAMMPLEHQLRSSGQNLQTLKISTLKTRIAEDKEFKANIPNQIEKSSKLPSLCVIPNGSKRMFSKLWPISRSTSEKN